jgi:flagellin-like protein
MHKRGVSPVIASVLMILMVVMLATIVFFWAKGFIGEQIEKHGDNIDSYCDKASFKIVEHNGELEVKNEGDVDIHGFSFEMTLGGTTEVDYYSLSVEAGSSGSGFYGQFKLDNGQIADAVVAHPVLIGVVVGKNRNSAYTCSDAGVVLDV